MPTDRQKFERIAGKLPMGRDPASVRRRIEAMETLLERVVRVPGTRFGFGLDAVLGLVPVAGDIVTAALGSWLVWEARNLGMSKLQLARMIGNVGLDTVLGAIPVVGDTADFFFRSNTRNIRIIRKWLDKHHPAARIVEGEVVGRREL